MPGGNRDQQLCENVPAFKAFPVGFPLIAGGPGKDDEDQGLPPLQPVHEQMSLRLKHAGAPPEELEGLRRGSGRESDDAYEFLVFRGISGCRDAAACCV